MKSPHLPQHRCHDYRLLMKRWRGVAQASGLAMKRFAEADGHPVYFLKSKSLAKTGGIYISAGIHGDEPAGTEALIAWAEQNVKKLSRLPCILFPCLNPWGVVNNIRYDSEHRDLNRVFHSDKIEMIRALKKLIRPHRFALALTLHEDFDGQGIYIYEIERAKPFWGEELLAVAKPIIPIEGRTMIDGRKSKAGIVRRKIILKKFATMGLPEAVYLHLHHSERTFTIETPSEFALDQRVRAHVAVIEECVRRVRRME